MGILNMWREARGNVMRQEYEDAMARMKNANKYAYNGFYNNLHQTAGHILEAYTSGSKSDRKAILKEARRQASSMWNDGSWPESLAVAIACLNAESRFVPGEDAAHVLRETDRVIKEAQEHFNMDKQ